LDLRRLNPANQLKVHRVVQPFCSHSQDSVFIAAGLQLAEASVEGRFVTLSSA
jgi:hypothetical protein